MVTPNFMEQCLMPNVRHFSLSVSHHQAQDKTCDKTLT